MADSQFSGDEYRFPDETAVGSEAPAAPEIEIEIEDDTPPEDRGRTPLPPPLVQELERDELDKYDGEVKEKLKQMRKVWHDERREKESALREYHETLNITKRLMQDNQRYREILSSGEKQYAAMMKEKAAAELAMAKKSYREAYDAGDAERIVEAQEAMGAAQLRLLEAEKFKAPSLQDTDFKEEFVQQPQAVAPKDPKLESWMQKNPWFGRDKEATAAVTGLHYKLEEQGYNVGSDEYYSVLDKTMRKRFPELFEETQESAERNNPRPRSPTVVAPAVRSTAPKKVRLTQSQLNSIKKLGITPEQYVREYYKAYPNG